MKIQESAENYLEMILQLSQENSVVRSIDIARAMNFTKPSISRAMSLFRQNGYITMCENGEIELTEKGMAVAQRTYHRHQTLSGWLESIGVSPATAARDACRLEHVISEESFEKIEAIYQNNTQK